MSQPVTFSVIIAARNAESTIEATIRSVIAQTRTDFEVIVVDDGSTDQTVACVEAMQDSARLRLVRQDNRGPGPARNAGIAVATGRYVSMLDSDDLWLPRYLEEMHKALEASSDIRFGYTDAWSFNEVAGRFRRATAMAFQQPPRKILTRDKFLRELVRRNFVFTSVTIRRDVINKVGGYAALPRAQDYDLWLRLTTAGYPGLPVKGPLAVYRVRSDSLSTDHDLVYASLRNIYERIASSDNLSLSLRRVARKRISDVDRYGDARMRNRLIGWIRMPPRQFLGLARLRLNRGQFLAEPPAEVSAAFPELCTSRTATAGRVL